MRQPQEIEFPFIVHHSEFIVLFHPSSFNDLERETRFELATLALARRCSTTELLPLRVFDSTYPQYVVKRTKK